MISPYFGDGTGLDTGREDGKLRRGGGRTLKHKFLQITQPMRELITALERHHTNTTTETRVAYGNFTWHASKYKVRQLRHRCALGLVLFQIFSRLIKSKHLVKCPFERTSEDLLDRWGLGGGGGGECGVGVFECM